MIHVWLSPVARLINLINLSKCKYIIRQGTLVRYDLLGSVLTDGDNSIICIVSSRSYYAGDVVKSSREQEL